jgi:pantoate--beta-alanine ligase
MQTIHDPSETQALCRSFRAAERTIGFVPTMGYLHEGHLSLMRRARQENDILVVSIFVNPTQFGPGEDYDTYPRDLDRDLRALDAVRADVAFVPSVQGLYPDGHRTVVEVHEITEGLCGASRPGHFRGVATVVTKLFNLVMPHRAYFGQKDYQQSVVVRRLVADLNLAVEIIVAPIVREPDGLAMSSRNARLTPEQRRAARVLYRALQRAEERVREGERQAKVLMDEMRSMIEGEPLASVEYIAACDPRTLREIDRIAGPALMALAVRFGSTRLIDNVLLLPS